MDCPYTVLFRALYGDSNKLSVSAQTKAAMLREQKAMREDWRITGTKLLPWPKIQFDNVITRLLNVVIDLVNTVMGKRRTLNWAQQAWCATVT